MLIDSPQLRGTGPAERTVIADRRIYVTDEDGTTRLAAAKGQPVSESVAVELGLIDKPAADDETAVNYGNGERGETPAGDGTPPAEPNAEEGEAVDEKKDEATTQEDGAKQDEAPATKQAATPDNKSVTPAQGKRSR